MYAVTKDFLGKPAPPGYVAGLGRGASGFTTRSDIGPAREAATATAAAAKDGNKQNAAAKRGRKSDKDQDDGDEARFANAENEEGLFSNMPYGQDDEEADRVWAMIDAKMEQRRAKSKSKQAKEEQEAEGKSEPDPELRGLKRQLEVLTEEEWGSIPDVSQLAESAARAKRRRKAAVGRRGERFTQVSDSTLVAGLGLSGYDQEIGADKPGDDGASTNFIALGQARDDVLRLRLDQAGDSASGKTTVDPRGYLTSLNTVAVQNAAEIGDIARARTLLKSVIQTNPKHAPGWIAAARLEEVAKKMGKARSIIAQGCENCAQSEDVWLEAARLNQQESARTVLASAVRNLPRSVKIWMCAAELEARAGETQAQRRILRRALEFIPTSVVLWKAAVALEQPEDARVLLAHAVELVPLSTDMWLALARLETYDKAQKVLNRARRAVPTSHEIWIAAARLEEQQQQQQQQVDNGGAETRVFRIMAKAVASLVSSGASMEREAWFAQALQCETDGYPVTCRATVSAAGNVGFDNEDTVTDRCDAWAAEAESFVPAQRTGEAANDNARGIVTARAIFALALDTQPARVDLWRSAADMERAHGGAEDLEQLLKRAVRYCPQAEVLWLMAAKEKWVHQGDVPGARVILEEAFTANPASEAIVLAAVKLESETGQHSRALKLLERARATGFASSNGGEQMAMGTPRVWMKSAVLLRQLDRADEALKLAGNAVELFPEFHKLWLIKAQLEDVPVARQTLSRALKKCSREPVLWTAAAQLELQSQQRNAARARAILERARVYIPREPLLWLEAVRLEAGENMDAARAVMARALQECPRAGMLWAEAILLEPRAQRKAKSVDAMRSTDAHDPFVTVVVARLFWSERRVDKARLWFERAARADPDFGDAWAWWLRFELEQRSLARISSPVADGALPATDGDATAATADGAPPADVHIARIETACAQAAPCHGQYWPQIAKAPANARLATKDVLYKVADFLGSTRQL